MPGPELLRVRGLTKRFPISRRLLGRPEAWLTAVDRVDLELARGETLGLVGESGSGKTTLGRCILHLLPPDAGTVTFDGIDLGSLSGRRLRAMRREMQIIFQDPFGSLNPRMRVGAIVAEPLIIHGLCRRPDRPRRVAELLAMVGLDADCAERYPHEFSGGQRQRIGIARALAVSPRLVIADEPVSSLDVSVQAQVLNLLVDLQERLGLTYLFIAHDLAVVRHISDRVAVMYRGRLVEVGPAAEVYARPLHPYTRALLESVPVGDPDRRGPRHVLAGEPPSPVGDLPGCAFASRCPLVEERCRRETPALREQGPGRQAACHLVEQVHGGAQLVGP
jgi:oligopeptide/dipeptide ABC transporter ATP-binding protein